MTPEEIIMVCTSDLAGQVRGKGFPAADLPRRLERGVAWTPTNTMITAHGVIAPSPWGALGDLILVPDTGAHFRVDFGERHAALNFVLGDIRHLDGTPWAICTRSFLRRILGELEARHGLQLRAAFEHELAYSGVEERPNASYALDALRRQDRFGEILLGALREAGLAPDTFMPEYGPRQYEVTVAPAVGVAAADQAVAVREIARAVAESLGERASFTPILRPDAVGNGLYVHFSLRDAATGAPANHDPVAPEAIDRRAAAFLAGVVAKTPAILAWTAAAPTSYLRLTPHRWSAAYNNLGRNDREAGLRICPVFETIGVDPAEQLHFEYRAADAAASPFLLLGAIVAAGLWGLDADLPLPAVTASDPDAMTADERAALDIERLPTSLGAALDRLEADTDLDPSIGTELKRTYLAHKRFELEFVADLSEEELCTRYAEIY
jgi:glutamine synthetase